MAQYTVVLTSGTLNLRSRPSTSGTILASIPNYATVTGVLIIPYADETITAEGRNWRSIEYNGKRGWVASEYLVSGNVPAPAKPATTTTSTTTSTGSAVNTTTNNNPQNSTAMFTLTEETKKKLKIGAVIVGVAVVGFGIYKMTAGKKQQALPAGTVAGLSGVSRRRKRKTGKRSKKTASKSKRKSFKLS